MQQYHTLQNMTVTKMIKVSAIRLLLSRSSSRCFSGQHGYTVNHIHHYFTPRSSVVMVTETATET